MNLENARFWGRIVKFIGFPLLGGFAYYTYQAEMEHFKHWEEHPPERKKYPYMKWRVKVSIDASLSFLEVLLGRW